MKSLRFISTLFAVVMLLSACSNKSNTNIPSARIIRYEQDLFNIDKNNLKEGLLELQESYPVFLSGDLNDTLNLIQLSEYLSDPMIIEFYNDCNEKYPDLTFLEKELGILKYNYTNAFPEADTFSIYTYVSGLDFTHPVVFLDSMMLIALDMYLGPEYEHYDKLGIPRYISNRFTSDHIARDAAHAVAGRNISQNKDNTLLAKMVADGKVLFAIEQLLPELHKNIIINYTEEQYKWSTRHEKELWAFFLKNDILFSSDPKFSHEYLLEAPSSPEFGEKAPARLGQFIGWQILRSYKKNNPEKSLAQIIDLQDANDILQASGYKP